MCGICGASSAVTNTVTRASCLGIASSVVGAAPRCVEGQRGGLPPFSACRLAGNANGKDKGSGGASWA